jgi:IPT/TIG domain
MPRIRIPSSTALASVVLSVLVASPRPSSAVSRPFTTPTVCGAAWAIVTSPNNGTDDNDLYGVAALSDTDAWAVGWYRTPTPKDLTLAEHWDGTAWTVIPTPNVGTHNGYLYDVDGSAANDAWAVGLDGTTPYKPIVEHWNGTAWSIVSSPAQTGDAILYGVHAIAANDVWAVGYHFTTRSETLVEHWNGTTWSVVPSPNVGTGSNDLHAIDGTSATDLWAGGTYQTTSARPLLLHWDGSLWTVSPSPDPGVQTLINGVAAVSATDAWAVGSFNATPYTQHWDGAAWTQVDAPGGFGASLSGVAGSGPAEVWATGTAFNATLGIHWTGAEWIQDSTPNGGNSFDILRGVDVADGHVFAAGTTDDGTGKQSTLIEETCPPTVSITGFSPPAGRVGSPVTITGTGLDGATDVTFNGTSALFQVVSSTEVRGLVPNGATTGPIAVITPQGTATSTDSFVVRPSITGFRPATGPVGTTVTIRGSNLTGATSVTFNGVTASFTVVSYSSIRTKVPAGASTGPIAVTTPDGQTKGRTDFVVT